MRTKLGGGLGQSSEGWAKPSGVSGAQGGADEAQGGVRSQGDEMALLQTKLCRHVMKAE